MLIQEWYNNVLDPGVNCEDKYREISRRCLQAGDCEGNWVVRWVPDETKD